MTRPISLEHDRVVAWLTRPSTYPYRPTQVDTIETHISHVFLTDTAVYKLKKPVRFEFLDFSTVERREEACRQELILNRRFAPVVYRSVHSINECANDEYEFDGEGRVVDWIVEMMRLPSDRMLDVLIQQQKITPEDVTRLEQFLSTLYASARPADVTKENYREDLPRYVRANRHDLLGAPLSDWHPPRNLIHVI